jgi:hypothetical protein
MFTLNKQFFMKDDNSKNEKQIKHEHADNDSSKGREKIEPLKKEETMEEKAKREGWTDVAQSHLGIDE